MKHRNAHHFVFSPKYRRAVLTPPIAGTVADLIQHIAHLKDMQVLALNVQRDHVHVFVDIPKTMPPSKAAFLIKWFSSIHTRRLHPEVKLIHKDHFWQKRYFSRSIGGDARTVAKYIQEQ